METTHDNRPATIYVTETSIYATYDDDNADSDPDVFFHVELDDPSVNVFDDLRFTFSANVAVRLLSEIGFN
jgi:hypothetical protein